MSTAYRPLPLVFLFFLSFFFSSVLFLYYSLLLASIGLVRCVRVVCVQEGTIVQLVDTNSLSIKHSIALAHTLMGTCNREQRTIFRYYEFFVEKKIRVYFECYLVRLLLDMLAFDMIGFRNSLNIVDERAFRMRTLLA